MHENDAKALHYIFSTGIASTSATDWCYPFHKRHKETMAHVLLRALWKWAHRHVVDPLVCHFRMPCGHHWMQAERLVRSHLLSRSLHLFRRAAARCCHKWWRTVSATCSRVSFYIDHDIMCPACFCTQPEKSKSGVLAQIMFVSPFYGLLTVWTTLYIVLAELHLPMIKAKAKACWMQAIAKAKIFMRLCQKPCNERISHNLIFSA